MEDAAASRQALHGVKWPLTSPKQLSVDFANEDEVCVLLKDQVLLVEEQSILR